MAVYIKNIAYSILLDSDNRHTSKSKSLSSGLVRMKDDPPKEALITAIEAMDPVVLGNAAIAATAMIFAFAFVGLIRYLMTAIGYSRMYRKAGAAPWKAFIPVFNIYNNYKISWNSKMFFLAAALIIASRVLASYTEGALALVSIAASLGAIYMVVKQNVKMAKRFGKGFGTGMALILFPGITALILGFNKSEFKKIEQ